MVNIELVQSESAKQQWPNSEAHAANMYRLCTGQKWPDGPKRHTLVHHCCMADRLRLVLLVSLGGAVQKALSSCCPSLLAAGAACLSRASGPQMCTLRVVVQSKAREYSGSPQSHLRGRKPLYCKSEGG